MGFDFDSITKIHQLKASKEREAKGKTLLDFIVTKLETAASSKSPEETFFDVDVLEDEIGELEEGKRILIDDVKTETLGFKRQLNKIRVAIGKWEKDKPEDCVNTYLAKITDEVEEKVGVLMEGIDKLEKTFAHLIKFFHYTGSPADMPNTEFFEVFLEFKTRLLASKNKFEAAEKLKRKQEKIRLANEEKARRKAMGGSGTKRKGRRGRRR